MIIVNSIMNDNLHVSNITNILWIGILPAFIFIDNYLFPNNTFKLNVYIYVIQINFFIIIIIMIVDDKPIQLYQ